jgi:hypothetical protein
MSAMYSNLLTSEAVISPRSRVLASFVDRTREFQEFEEMLQGSSRKILHVYGPGGIGKSLLIERMRYACHERGVYNAHIEWEDARPYTYLDIMRRVRDDTRQEFFQIFNDRVNFYTVPDYRVHLPSQDVSISDIPIQAGATIQQSDVSIHVGHEIKDLHLNVLRPDRDVSDEEVIAGVTGAFMPCMQALTADCRLVLFFDAMEKIGPADLALSWIKRELLERICDGELPNILVVLASRLPLDLDPTFFDYVAFYELRPFQGEDIQEYLQRRGLSQNSDFVDFILANFEGNPLRVAMSVNNFIRRRSQR